MPALRIVRDAKLLVTGPTYRGSLPGRIVAASCQGALEAVLSHYILDAMIRMVPRLPRLNFSRHQAA